MTNWDWGTDSRISSVILISVKIKCIVDKFHFVHKSGRIGFVFPFLRSSVKVIYYF